MKKDKKEYAKQSKFDPAAKTNQNKDAKSISLWTTH